MATNLSFVSLVQRNQHPSHDMWIWNTKQTSSSQSQDPFDNFWEFRAFVEDRPRSYMCTFCRREFQSAQALGGHMNMHRGVRARLGQTLPAGVTHPSPLTIHNVSNGGGLHILYQFPGPNCNVSNPDSSSTLLPISSCSSKNPNQVEKPTPTSMPCRLNDEVSPANTKDPTTTGELDLELRL